MEPIKIYHNPRCRKCREGLRYLQEKGIQPVIIDYMSSPLTEDEISDLVKLLGIRPIDMVRTHEELFKKELKNKNFTDQEWIKILAENPQLIKRPIVVTNQKAVLGQSPEAIDNIL